jgi:hypothetical protein
MGTPCHTPMSLSGSRPEGFEFYRREIISMTFVSFSLSLSLYLWPLEVLKLQNQKDWNRSNDKNNIIYHYDAKSVIFIQDFSRSMSDGRPPQRGNCFT